MRARKIQVFFYGAFMSLPMLEKAGLAKRAFAPAILTGFELAIAPHATLVDSGDGIVYGIVANLNHAELEKLYDAHSDRIAELSYNPEPVIVHTRGGKHIPALTYITTDLSEGPPKPGYCEMIAKAASDYGFPKWYIERIKSMGA